MITLHEIAQLINGEVVGDSKTTVVGVATIDNAHADDLTFAVDNKLVEQISTCCASAAVVPQHTGPLKIPTIEVDDVQESFAVIARFFRAPIERIEIGISPRANVSPTAKIGKNVTIYAGAYVGDATTIGDDTRIFPNACIMEKCTIGRGVSIFPNAVLYEYTNVGDGSIVHAGAVLGAYGFGYESTEHGHLLSEQLGNVEICNNVEVGANTTVDRATYGTTRIDDGSKLDNQVMIGHNCQIGKHNLLCSQVGIAGSCRTGDFVVIAGQVGIGDHLHIGDRVVLWARSGVIHNLKAGQSYFGAPARPVRENIQILAAIAKLPAMKKQLKQLQKRFAKEFPEPHEKSGSDTREAA